MDERIDGATGATHCTNCIYKNLCTPFEKLLYVGNITEEDKDKKQCQCFIDINGFDNDNNYTNGENIWQEMCGESAWKEMSWHKYKDNLFDYIEDN